MRRGCTSAADSLNGRGCISAAGAPNGEGVHKCGCTKWGGGAQVPFKGPKKSQAPRKVSILCTGTI